MLRILCLRRADDGSNSSIERVLISVKRVNLVSGIL